MGDTIENVDLDEAMSEFAQRIVKGIGQNSQTIDGQLSDLIKDYDFHRIAAVDRNVMRIAAYELRFEPGIPPAVSLNEAIELAKKYSTAESGKFVNGVLGKLLTSTPKANWDVSQLEMTPEIEEPDEPAPTIEVETISEDAPETKELAKAGLWRIKSEEV
jgi:N utilization substance protein B